MIRCNGTFVHVKLTLYAKECKLPLVHMQTEYRGTVMQNVKLPSATALLVMKKSCFWIALESSLYERQIMKELWKSSLI